MNAMFLIALIGIGLTVIAGPLAVNMSHQACHSPEATPLGRRILLAAYPALMTAGTALLWGWLYHRPELAMSGASIADINAEASERGSSLMLGTVFWASSCLSYGLTLWAIGNKFGETPVEESQ